MFRGYHIYTWAATIGEVLVCSMEPTNTKIFVVKLYLCKIISCFLCTKIFLQQNKSEIK